MSDVYEPAEDSWLMEDAVRLFAKGTVLDMGTGSGILAAAASETADKVIGADINPDAIAAARKSHPDITFLQSDLFSNLHHERFDLIIFNPPYLPTSEDDPDDIALNGGKDGDAVLLRFMEAAPDHLELAGSILFLASSLTKMKRVNELIKKQGFQVEVVQEKKEAFEKLTVYRVWR